MHGVEAMSRIERVLAAIDAANSADPTLEASRGEKRPAALLYGLRMSDELARLCPDASEELRIAARGQHVERWTSPRSSYPEGRAGYLAWRADLSRFHADRVAGLMREAGYDADSCSRVGRLLRKEGIKRDPEMQMLEDVICFVFIRWYLADFAGTQEPDALERIVAKTARKMSTDGRARAAREFEMPESLGAYFAA
jgi:Domain of unknown function (DUF4202)